MSDPITVFCRDQLNRAQVMALILERGGRVHEEGDEVGAISSEGANLWIFFDPMEPERTSTMEDFGHEIFERLGGPYGSSVTFEVGKAKGSAKLALDFAIACCERWSPAFATDAGEAMWSLDELFGMRDSGQTFLNFER